MKVLPLDHLYDGAPVSRSPAAGRSRLLRLFSFNRMPPCAERIAETGVDQMEPSSVCLDRMVRSFLEGGSSSGERPPPTCGRSRCVCFLRGVEDRSSDVDTNGDGEAHAEGPGVIKGLVQCASAGERALMADVVAIVERSRSNGSTRKAVVESLIGMGYKASICQTRWEKTASIPAGKYEYIQVMLDGEGRVLLDVDFRSQFEIARPTELYRKLLQLLPAVFVGKAERLRQIVAVATEAVKQSLKKKGLHVPPWRKHEYMRAKWFSPVIQLSNATGSAAVDASVQAAAREKVTASAICQLRSSRRFGPFNTISARKITTAVNLL